MSCHLRLLGEAVLETSTGGYSLSTGKASALLVHLAYRGEQVRRESVMALLWPESLEERARNSLRQVLHTLRRAAFTRDLEVTDRWLSWRVPTDVATFQRALHKGDTREALIRYGGSFLAGFTESRSEAFDVWLEGEREVLHAAYRHAVFARAGELRSDPAAAAAALGQLLRHDPFDEDALAARLELLAQAGQVRQALAEYESYVKRLYREFGETPGGMLQELAAGLNVARVTGWGITPGAPLGGSTVVAEPGPVTPAHTPLSSFVGRTYELAELQLRLRDSGCRLFTLLGPGGMGKTRLAQDLLPNVAGAFRDGALFVLLEAVGDASGLGPALAAQLELALTTDQDHVVQIGTHLAKSECLLILDNFEGLLDGKAFLTGLLERAPGLKLLVTSRERLNLPQEEVFELQGLSLLQDEDGIETSEAAQLFLQGAKRAGKPLKLDDAARRAVADICARVGGMPLALELTSAWLRLLNPEEIARELETGLDLLVEPGSALPERHRSMRLILGRTWERLDQAERRVLGRLSVFRGGLSFGAAKAVTGLNVGTLLALSDKALVSRSEAGRLSLHELVRQYAAERLHAEGGSEEAQEAHARYYLGLLGTLEMWSEHEPASLATLDFELDNVRTAWRWAAANGALPALLPQSDVVVYFDRRMRFLEGLELIASASTLYDPSEPGKREMLASLSTDRAWLLFRLARYAEAEAFAHRTLELSEKPGTRMKAFNTLGIIARQQGRYAEAAAHIQGALKLAQELGEMGRVAAYMNNLAATYNEFTQHERAEAASRAALNLHRAVDDTYGIVTTLLDMTITRMALGDYPQALNTIDEALILARSKALDDVLVVLVLTRAQVLYRLGNLREAKQSAQEVLVLTKDPGHTPNRVMTLNLLGRIATQERELTQARRYLTQGFLLAWRYKDTPTVLENVVATAELEFCEHQPERAYTLLVAATGHPAVLPSTRRDAEMLLSSYETLPAEADAVSEALERWLPTYLGIEAQLD